MVRIQYFRKVFLNCVFFFLHIACLKMRPQWPVIYPGPKRFSENLWHPEYLSLDTCSESVQTYARANYFACSIRKMRQIGEILRKRIFIVKEEKKKHDLGSFLAARYSYTNNCQTCIVSKCCVYLFSPIKDRSLVGSGSNPSLMMVILSNTADKVIDKPSAHLVQ